MVIGLIKMFVDRSRIRKVAIVENGASMLPKALMEMALGLPNVLFAAFFSFNQIVYFRMIISQQRNYW